MSMAMATIIHVSQTHPAVFSDDVDVSSRALFLLAAEAEDPERRVGVESASVAAESADRFCLLADPGPDDDDPPCSSSS